ncbi:hypothetical protein MRQ36_21735 [Micromonospora sp. R77]|uniref:hypothetical protein n=1 Tax=Micromonospora sp. R77 TaxID=2925836 RepID=UPI001F623737|nr:hypothetical protein [Micromonospora sp. R77]MCI4065041.1 hypothetical protein [Micromonospora sp. R77]
MAFDMHPARARRQMAMDRAQRAWEERHGITNGDWEEDHHPDRPGQPTAEQLEELEREFRLINGQDPETGQYPERDRRHDPSHLPARTHHEAHLHLDLTPCPCGGRGGEISSAGVDLGDDDEVGRRYTQTCTACGASRAVVYRLPSVPYVPAGPLGFGYGDREPSRLIDAAQWLWVADRYAALVPPGARDLPPADRDRARGRLVAATAALDEVLKFVPPGASRVPEEAVWTPMGRALRERDGARLDAGRISAVRAAYLEVLTDLAGRDELTGRSLGDAAAALATYREIELALRADQGRWYRLESATKQWARRHRIDDRDWTEDGWAGDDRRRPSAEQAWEMVREARQIAARP